MLVQAGCSFTHAGDVFLPAWGREMSPFNFLKETILAKVSLILGKKENEKLLSLIKERKLVRPENILPFDYTDDKGNQLSLVALHWTNLQISSTLRFLCEFASALQDYEFCWAEKKGVIHEGNYRFMNL